MLSELLPEEIGDEEQSGSTAQENGDPLCSGNKAHQSDLRTPKRQENV